MDFPFLFETRRSPHKVAKLWGLYRLSIKILGGMCPQNLSNLTGTLWGKTASPKKERKIHFWFALRTAV